jgi:peptidyl-prolyl cis-trans isomerase D
MAIMEKMRNSTTAILWLLIFSFGLLWVLADTQMFDAISAGPRQLGEVNGEPISFEAYNARVSYYLDQHSQQYGGEITPEIRALYEEQAWNDLVQANLVQQKIAEIGIEVTDQELVDMIVGPNPDPFIRQQFADDNGAIDQVALRAAIEAPENSEIWIMIESQLREKRRQQKISNYLAAAGRVTQGDVEREYLRANTFADVRYVRLPYAAITDSMVSVTDDEISRYYRDNKDQFKREASYDFSYVSFPVIPTADDTARTFEEVAGLRESFRTAESDSAFLVLNESIIPFNPSFVASDEIREEFRPVTALRPGEVSEVVTIDGNPYVFKLIERRAGQIKFGVLARAVVADPLTTVDGISELAEDFRYYAETDGFEEEAQRLGYAVESSFTTKGAPFAAGLGQSLQLPAVLERLENGDISDVVELQGQFVVLRMNERIDEGSRPLDEVRSVINSRLLQEKKADKATDELRKLVAAATSTTVDALAEEIGLEVGAASDIRMDATVISEIGREPLLVGAVFAQPVGTLSKVIKGVSAAYVVEVTDRTSVDLANVPASSFDPIRLRLQQERTNEISQALLPELQKEAKIKDFRSILLQ